MNPIENKIPLFLTLAAASFGGFANAASTLYSFEDFEGGTVNYAINGVNGTGAGGSWEQLTDNATAMAGTDYLLSTTNRQGIVANGNPTDITPGGIEPTGQHGFVSSRASRRMNGNFAMTLATDNIESLNVSFSFMAYALEDFAAAGAAYIAYSADGTFGDDVILASFGVGQDGLTPTVPATEETWTALDLSFTEAGSGITFTDTAAISIIRVAPATLPTGDTATNHITFFDDVVVSGTVVPEPSSTALLGLGGLALLLRRRK